MAEEINEWELAQDFTPQEDIKKKNTEKSSSEFRAGFIKPSPSGSDGLGTSEIDTWESTLSDEQKKDVVPVKPKAQQPVKKKDLSEFLPKLNEAVPSTTATKVEVQPVSEGRDIKVKTALNDVAMRISKDSPIVQQKDALEADLLSSKDIIDELTQAYEQEQDINKKQEIGLKLNDLVQNFNSKLPEYQKIEDSLKNDYALYSSLNKGYEAIKKLPELQKELEDYKKRKDDPVGNFVAGLYNTAVPATLKAVGSLVNLTGDLGASYTASLGDPTAIAEEMYGGDKDKVTDNIDKALRGLADDIEIKLPDEIKQLTSYNLGAGAGSTLSILGTSLIGGAPAGVATGFGLSFDSIKEEALNKGYTEKEANLISSLISLPVAALDQIGIAPLIEKYGANKISNALFKRVSTELAGKEITKETISKSISKGISDIVMDKTLMLAKEGGTEFVTEFAQSGLESLGKATADVIKGEDKFDIKPKQAFKDALIEGAYGFGSTGIIGTPGAVYQGVSEIFSDDKTLYSEIKKLAQDEDYYNRFEKQLEVDVKLGKKTQEDVDNILDNIKAVAEIESKLPSNVTSDNKRIQAISLVRQKQDLQKQLETADENFKPAVESKIRDTQETINKITTGQALTDEDVLNSEYSVQKDKNGIPVFYKKFDGDTYEVTRDIFEKELNQKNKLLKDAAKIEEKQTNEIERKVTDEQLRGATSIKRKPSTTEQSKTEEQVQEQYNPLKDVEQLNSKSWFHGSENEFDEFENKNPNITGFWFSDDKENAMTYGNKIKEVRLDIKNPLIIDANGKKFTDDIEVEVLAKYPNEKPYITKIELPLDEIVWMAKNGKRKNSFIELVNSGYDAVVFKNIIDPALSSRRKIPQTSIAVLDKKQIKKSESLLSKEQTPPALKDVESTAKALENRLNPDFKNTIEDKLSKFDEQIANKKFPSALEVAEQVLPRKIFNKYKSLYELAARNNITVSNERLPQGFAAAWGFNKIQINKDVSKYYLNDYNEFAETLNHEIIHGLLSRGIRDNYALFSDLQGVMEQVVSKFDSASNEVKDIISYIQDTRNEFTEKDFYNASDSESESGKYREVGSLEELITYAFTNSEFAKFLDSIPASKNIEVKGNSIFQQLKNIIRNFISNKTKSPTALDEINSVIDKYFDTSWNEKNIAERNKQYEWDLKFNAENNIFDKYNNDSNKIAEAYYKAKADESNPELVKAVEDLIGVVPEKETPTPTVEVLGEDLNYKRKQEVQQELDSAKEAFRKATQGLSSFGQLQAIPEFVNLVKAYAKFGVVRIDEAVQFIKEAIGDKIKNFSDQDIQIAIEKTVKKIKEAESKEVKKAVSKTINKSVSSNIEGKVSNKDISKKLEKAIYDFGVAVGQEKAGEKVTKLEDKIKFKKELQNQVDQLLKDKDFRNHINNSDATITAVANKARKINTQKQLDNFVDYLNKLAEDGKYNEKIERAKSNNIDGLLTKSAKKTVPFDLFNSLKELSRIGKKLVSLSIQDLEDYTRIVEQIKRNGIKPTIKDGIISYGNVSQSEIDSFLDRVVKEEDKSVFKNPMLDEIKRLDSKYGSIDVTLDTEDPNTGLTSSRAFKSFEELGLAQIKGEITTDQYIDAINKVLKEFKDIIDNRGNDLKVELRNYVDSIGYDNFSDSEKEVIKDLMNTDPKLLNEGESLLFTNVLTNIIDNNNFNGSRVISDIGAATKKIKSLEKISDLVRKNIKGRWYVERFFSKPMILDAMTKTLKASRELSKYTNFDNIMNKSAEAKTKWQQYIKRYNDIIKKYKKKGIDLNSAESDYRRGIINNVFQFLNHESNIAAMDKEFQERLLDVVSDIEKHRKAQDDKSVIGKENKFKADLIEKALNSLGINSNMGFKEAYDIISKKYPGEVELVEESKRTFADNLEMFKANTEIGNNKQFKEYYNYGPTKVHNTNRKESDIAESGKTTFTKESLSRKQVGSSIARTGKGDTSVWDYNFDNISSRVLLEQLLDSHIQRETIITQKILDSDEAKEIIGADNIEIIKNAIIDKLNEDYYTTPVDNAVNKDIGKFFLGLNKRYVQVLLGSANQFLKQYVGVITDAMFQVGLNNWSKAVVVSVKKAETTKRLLDRFPIGERLRETPAFSYDISDKELERSTIDVRNPLTKLVSKTLEAEGNLNKSWGEGIMYSLKWADNRAAVHTWLAAYGKYIIDEKNKKQQVRYSAIPFKFEDIDWEAEASNSNQDAANYAEQVVSRTQYISDPSLGAKALKSRNIGDVIIKSMLFPLATFTINNKNRIITDIANVRTDKGAKGRIAGYIAGIAMYNAGLLGLKEMGEAAAESIAESLGFSGDKDDEDDSKKFEKWWKDVVMEMTFGGIEIPEVTLKYMINTAASFYKAEEIERAEADLINAQREDEKERLIDEYSETITPEEEEKGITPEDKYKNHIADLKKHVGDKKEPIYDFYTRNIGRGNTTLISEIAEKILKKINKVDDIDDTDLTVSEQNKYSNAFITLSVLEGLSVVGWSEGTINSLAKKIEKNVKESLKKDIKTAKENKERKRIEEDEQQ